MKVQFYGVRGSIASASPATQKYGGNTPCVSVQAAGEQLIFDAGTGIRALGSEIGPIPVQAHLFFSHLHWDHIQGFPFFTPAYVPGNQIHLHGVKLHDDTSVASVLHEQMRAPTFPVGMEMMRADIYFDEIALGHTTVVGDLEVRHSAVDHPNGCVAYRVEGAGASLVYATDLEQADDALSPELVDLCRGADLLIYDAMYTPEEYVGTQGFSKKGWGHSTFVSGARLAEEAGVKTLCLFHHDPSHDDDFMDQLGKRAQERFARTIVAKEGLVLDL